MLTTMRSGAGGLAAKILLGLLILSFSVWGIEDMLRHGGRGQRDVATVGDTHISRLAFLQEFRAEENRIQQALGAEYSPALLQTLNIHQQVLQRMVTREMIQMEAKRLGIVVSDEDVARDIRETPAFKDEQGKFSRERFMNALKHQNISERRYADNVKDQIASDLLLSAVTAAKPSADIATRILSAGAKEQRTADLVVVSAASAASGTPEGSALEAFYQDHEQEFLTPERRKLSYLKVPKETLAKSSNEESAAAERDDAVSKMSADLQDRLAGGSTLSEVAKDMGFDAQTVGPFDEKGLLPNGSKAALPPLENVMRTAFTLAEQTETALMMGQDGNYYMLYMDSIEPSAAPPLETVKDKVIAKWRKEEAAKLAESKASALANQSREGKGVKEAGVSVTSTGAIGRDATKGAGVNLPQALVGEIFSADIGGVTGVHRLENGDAAYAVLRARRAAPIPSASEFGKGKDEAEMIQQRGALASQMNNELMQAYLQSLARRYPITVNEEALDAVLKP